MTKLSVNINKIATLRNSRGGNNPDVIQLAIDIQRFGADGITVHPRPDERHIRYDDVRQLKKVITTEFNIEGNPTEQKFVDLVLEIKPQQVTFVPDTSGQLTSNHGWDTLQHQSYLREMIPVFQRSGIRVSIFVDPDVTMVAGAAETGTDRIELYTEGYAKKFAEGKHQALIFHHFRSQEGAKGNGATQGQHCNLDSTIPYNLKTNSRLTQHPLDLLPSAVEGDKISKLEAVAPYIVAAQKAQELGLGLNAGHDLDLKNLEFFKHQIPWLDEVSIGHALICDALYLGLEQTIQQYKEKLANPNVY